jgi:hypothetical protein
MCLDERMSKDMTTPSTGGSEAAPETARPVVVGRPTGPSHPTGPHVPPGGSSPGASDDSRQSYYPGVVLRPLDFEPVSDDGRHAVYVAKVDHSDAPGRPVFAVTVTVPSPDPEQRKTGDVPALLAQFSGDFWVREKFGIGTGPDGADGHPPSASLPTLRPPDGDRPEGDEPADDDEAVRIQVELVQIDAPAGVVGVVAVIQSTIAAVPGTTFHGVRTVQDNPQCYSVGHGTMHVTVTAQRNSALIFPPPNGHLIPEGATFSEDAPSVCIRRGGNAPCTYLIDAKCDHYN